MNIKASLTSPRVALLKKALENGSVTALEAFWHEITTQGTPLLETLADDAANVLVTFVWRDADIENVVLFSFLFWHVETFALKPLSRLLETDLWYLTELVPSDAQATYFFSPNDPLTPLEGDGSAGLQLRQPNFQPDPLNLHRFVFPADSNDTESKDEYVSVVKLPQAPAQLWIVPQAAMPKGQLEQHILQSKILDNQRTVLVYIPPNYNHSQDNQKYPVVLLFDSWACLNLLAVATILDNLIGTGQLPPMIAVMLDSINSETRNKELPCYAPFTEFLAQEAMPWLRQNYHVTDEPASTVISGISYGGLAAVYAGLTHSEIFGKVLSQSGSFWWKPPAYHEHEWLTRQFVIEPKLEIEFYIEVGLFERTDTPDKGPTQLIANRHLRDVLQAKDYVVHYHEFSGGHEYLNWRGTFANGLLALLVDKNKVTIQPS